MSLWRRLFRKKWCFWHDRRKYGKQWFPADWQSTCDAASEYPNISFFCPACLSKVPMQAKVIQEDIAQGLGLKW